MYNRGTKYLYAGKYVKALACYKKALLTDSFKELYLNMGNTYRRLNKDDLALSCYLTAAAETTPFANGTYGKYALAINNIGLLHYALGDDNTAMDCYAAALALDPAYGEAVWNYGNAQLRSTNCLNGWDLYEYRFNRGEGSVKIDNSVPRWDGVSSGSEICVITEQGLGDKIMFGRYLRCLAKYFDKIVVVCHESLDCLFSDYECIRAVRGDVSIPICSLAGIFGMVSERWLDGKFLPCLLEGKNIGIVWNGSITHANNANRSCSPHHFKSLAKYGKLWSLNPADSCKWIESSDATTWDQTASFILGLDLIVSVDTSIVHLAGTLGVPCLMLQPLKETDFRWGMDVDNVWYESVKCIPNNDWDKTFAVVDGLVKKVLDV
ncbi:MAG: hypothetical protein QX189_09700 [Methylococcales bacterium]